MLKAYWWEGYFGFKSVLRRTLQGKRPYIYNFGDQLSPFILSQVSGLPIKHSIGKGKLLALGSIFFALNDDDHVWGSGLLQRAHSRFAAERRNVIYHAVRGPETRKELLKRGIDCPEIYGDPALLLPLFAKNNVDRINSMGVVPHFSHYDFFQRELDGKGASVIDVERPFEEVVRSILSCKIILATSLHGLIVAEAYGIPALLIKLKEPSAEETFKFEDYFHSTQRSLAFSLFESASNLGNLVEKAVRQPPPKINLGPLLNAFPYRQKSYAFQEIKWTELKDRNFQTSICSPRLTLPSS